APEPLLRLRREVGEDQLVHRVVLVHPGRARAAAAELRGDARVGGEALLVAAVGARLEDPEETGVFQLADRLLGHAALALAALGALAQARHERTRAREQLVARRIGRGHSSSTGGSTPGTSGANGATSSVRPRPPASIAAPIPANRRSKHATGSAS